MLISGGHSEHFVHSLGGGGGMRIRQNFFFFAVKQGGRSSLVGRAWESGGVVPDLIPTAAARSLLVGSVSV